MSNKPQVPHTMDDFSMGRPVAGFSQTRTGMWIGVSLLLHIVLITGTSLGFIRDTWIDPEAAKERKAKAAEEEAQKMLNEKAKAFELVRRKPMFNQRAIQRAVTHADIEFTICDGNRQRGAPLDETG